jgi:HlyD family secretion protein
MIRWIVLGVVVLGVVVGGLYWYLYRDQTQATSYRTAEVKRGTLLVTISATGTVEPEEVVDVGAQVAGLILSFGKDANGKTVDYGSAVEEGTVLATIDDTLYAADAAQANAQLVGANAAVVRAKADLGQMNAKLTQAQADWDRAQKLGSSEALAQTTFDAYKSTFETAKANVDVDVAAIDQAKATVTQAQAQIDRAQRNLDYCVIKSPVKGVIIDRRVNIGQTVVSSLNAPSLFLIAKDLKRMQVWVAVNEADIGSIHAAQPVTFTVDAFPGRTFQGTVGKVRLNASMTQNVVTYTVEIVTDNSDGKLLPYLTANVQFELNRLANVLLVPNAALTWLPESIDQVTPQFRTASTEAGGIAGGEQPAHTGPTTGTQKHAEGVLWVEDGAYVKPVKVHAGATDGTNTEVEGDGLPEGMKVVVGAQDKAATAQAVSTNPFLPQFRRTGSGSGSRSGSGSTGGSGPSR